MTNSGLTGADVLALTRDNDGFSFGGVGGFILLFIFLLAIGGNGFFGTNGNMNQMATADLLYNQSTDSAIRGLAQGQCNIIDNILNANYNNLLASKDVSNQISTQTLSITEAINNSTNTIMTQMQNNVIQDLRDKLDITRGELSNVRQTSAIFDAINNQTNEILTAQGRYVLNPPCYTGCGCNSLY